MDTLIPDLFKIVDAKLDIVEHILLNESPTNDYINYTTNPKWLLFLIKKGTSRYWVETDVLVSDNHVDWLKHLVIHRQTASAFINLCRISKMSLDKRPELYSLALNNNMIDIYNSQIFETSIMYGRLDDFIAYVKDMEIFDTNMFVLIYEYGHQNIIDYIETHPGCSYVLNNNRSKIVHGMIRCKNRTYNRDLIKWMLVNAIAGKKFKTYLKFLCRCSEYVKDIDLIIEVFGTKCYTRYSYEMLDSALKGNNSIVVDYLLKTQYTRDKRRCLEMCIKYNSISYIREILKDNTVLVEFGYLDLFNTTIETVDLIFPYLSTKLTVADVLEKLQYTQAYVLFCHLMQLI